MDNLLFYALIAALLYYFLIYLPQQKKISPDPKPSTTSQSTQTAPITYEYEYEPGPSTVNLPPAQSVEDTTALEKTLDQMIKSMADLSKDLDKIK